MLQQLFYFFFFFNDTATTEIYTLSLHDALPIYILREARDGGPKLASPWEVRDARLDPLRVRRKNGHIARRMGGMTCIVHFCPAFRSSPRSPGRPAHFTPRIGRPGR